MNERIILTFIVGLTKRIGRSGLIRLSRPGHFTFIVHQI